jgi:ABC-type multidrug transport system permease subunit
MKLKTSGLNPRLINKILLAILLLSALAVVAGSQLVPKVPLLTVLLYRALGVLGIGALVLAATVVTLTIYQWVLRKGGTDPQWFWFSGDPPGLQKLRAEAQAQAHKDGV